MDYIEPKILVAGAAIAVGGHFLVKFLSDRHLIYYMGVCVIVLAFKEVVEWLTSRRQTVSRQHTRP
jgi:uncharacterized membrane protein YfcA